MELSKATSFLADFVKTTNKNRFTYKDIQEFFFSSTWKNKISYHTVERYLRKLAQHGFIARKKMGRTVEFITAKSNIPKLLELKRRYYEAIMKGDYNEVKSVIDETVTLYGVSVKDAVEILSYYGYGVDYEGGE